MLVRIFVIQPITLDLMKCNALFIHLPYCDGQVLNEPSMDIDKMVQGVKLVIDDILNK